MEEKEIHPTKFYRPGQAHKLIGVSIAHLYNLANSGDLKYEINKRTGYKMYKGLELIKFINNNPT